MTVSSQTSNETFHGNGVTTIWDLPFRFFDNADITVRLIDPIAQTSTPLVLGTDYTLSGAGLPEQFGVAPGKITTTLPVANGKDLYVERLMEAEQLTDIVNQGRFFPEVHEDVFDRLTMLIQQGFSLFSRALLRPLGLDYYDAENRRIANVADPVELQDAATRGWSEQFIADILATGQGPVNNAANVIYSFPNGTIRTVQALSGIDGAEGIGYKGGNVFDRLALTITPKDKNFGAIGDGIVDDTAAILAWAASTLSKRKYLPTGTYKVSAEVIFNPGDYIYGDGDSSVIDASAGIGGALRCVSVTGALVALPNLASNVNLRANTLPFVSAPSVGFGDVILIWNPTDFSWSNWRADYRAGEWCRAAIVTGSSVQIYGRTYDSYVAGAVQMYKLVGPQTTLKDFRIKQPFTSNAGLVVDLIDSPIVENVSAGGGVYAGIDVRRCVDKKINCRPKQASTPSGNNYGLAIGNSQGGTVEGVYYGTRHSISIGGSPGVGSVSCRDIDIYASYKALDGGINSVDLHGNSEDIRFHGVGAQNGFVVAGKNNSWYGGAGEGGTNSGIALYMGEVVEGKFNFVGLTLKSLIDPNPSGNGMISFQNFTANIKGDCNFIFSGLVMDCPDTMTFPILFALNGTTKKINLSFPGGITFTNAPALTQVLRLRQFGATGQFGNVSMPEVNGVPSTGCAYVSEVGSPVIGKYELPTQCVKTSIAVTTAASVFTQNMTFPHAYPASRVPVVIPGGGNPTVAGKRVVTGAGSETNAGFVGYVATTDVTNFTSAGTADYKWSASLNEM